MTKQKYKQQPTQEMAYKKLLSLVQWTAATIIDRKKKNRRLQFSFEAESKCTYYADN